MLRGAGGYNRPQTMATANVQPYEIVAGPAKVYVAAVGTPFPAIDSVYGVDVDFGTATWKSLGHTDGGVQASHAQTIVPLRTDQVTAPVKMVRSEEDLEITFSLAELKIQNYATVLNQAIAGATVDGNSKKINLYRGGSGVETFALLVRGDQLSPEGPYNLQYEVPNAYQGGAPQTAYTKDAKALLACAFMAIAANAFVPGTDDEDIFGVFRVGTA